VGLVIRGEVAKGEEDQPDRQNSCEPWSIFPEACAAGWDPKTLRCLMKAVSLLNLLDAKVFVRFRDFILEYAKEYISNVRILSLVAQLFTTIRLHNPILLRQIFYIMFHPHDQVAAAAILSVGNTFCQCDDFVTAYSHGLDTHVGAAFQRTSSESLLTRQASFKILILMVTKPSNSYTIEVPISLAMGLTSQTAIGYSIQASHFIPFASRALKSDCIPIFHCFS
jgi:hypothetical protein